MIRRPDEDGQHGCAGRYGGACAADGVCHGWGVLSALAAPLLLVAGWTIASVLQPRPFSTLAGTVSALAAVGAADRWVMTFAFAAHGACEVVTGLALRPAAAPGRLILMAGGLAFTRLPKRTFAPSRAACPGWRLGS